MVLAMGISLDSGCFSVCSLSVSGTAGRSMRSGEFSRIEGDDGSSPLRVSLDSVVF